MSSFRENVQTPHFLHKIPLNPQIKIFFKIPALHAKCYKDLIMESYRTLMDRRMDRQTDKANYMEPAFS